MFGPMVAHTKVALRMAKKTVKENGSGRLVSMKELIKMIARMVLVNFNGKVEANIKEVF